MTFPTRLEHLVVHELDDEVLLYDPTIDRSHRLNATATVIWRHCDGRHAVEDLARILTDVYDVEYAGALRDTRETLSIMEEERMISTVAGAENATHV